MEITVAGKKVVIRDKIPLKDGYAIFGAILGSTNDDLRTQVPVLMQSIESWEFEGDPSDASSYDELDTIRIIIPLSRIVHRHLNSLMSGTAEELEDVEKN